MPYRERQPRRLGRREQISVFVQHSKCPGRFGLYPGLILPDEFAAPLQYAVGLYRPRIDEHVSGGDAPTYSAGEE
jgi:hypothetical protein